VNYAVQGAYYGDGNEVVNASHPFYGDNNSSKGNKFLKQFRYFGN